MDKEDTHKFIMNLLHSCPYIKRSANTLGIGQGSRVTVTEKGSIKFALLEAHFKFWLHDHEDQLGLNFRLKGTREYTKNPDLVQYGRHWCSHAGMKRHPVEKKAPAIQRTPVKKRAPVVYSTKTAFPRTVKKKEERPRNRSSFKCQCQSRFNTVLHLFRPPGKKAINAINVEYWINHNHFVYHTKTVGTKRVTEFMKTMITHYLQEGFLVTQIQKKIDSDFSKAAEKAKASGKRPNRDYHLTYMDIYNIQYQAYVKNSEKSPDVTESAHLWMEELHGKGYFTYMDGNGSYGFSSPWQIKHLLKSGHTLCFDGTHEIFG